MAVTLSRSVPSGAASRAAACASCMTRLMRGSVSAWMAVIRLVMSSAEGRADGKQVSAKVREALPT